MHHSSTADYQKLAHSRSSGQWAAYTHECYQLSLNKEMLEAEIKRLERVIDRIHEAGALKKSFPWILLAKL